MNQAEPINGGVTGIARQAIPFMTRKGIPLLPNNYRIWFEYFRGVMTDLKEAIDNLLEASDPFDTETHRRLYQRFLDRDIGQENEEKIRIEIEAVDRVSQASRDIIEPVVKDLLGLSRSNSAYSGTLEEVAKKATPRMDPAQFGGLVQTLVKETIRTVSENRKMSQELGMSSEQLRALRENLERVRAEARTDDLTKLSNRRAFNEDLPGIIASVAAGKNEAMLAIVDLDHFKTVNDSFGHSVGDRVLEAIAGQLSDNLAAGDRIYRYGGEEFAIVMTGVSLDQAIGRLDLLRREVANHEFVARGQVRKITVSIGVAAIDGKCTGERCLCHADEAMYLAKQSGRNQVKSERDL